MSGLMGGGSSAQKDTKYIGIQVQSSLRGVAIGRGWGTFKAGCNLLDYVNFEATANSGGGKGSGGKGGGGGKSGGTTYSYSCNPLLGIVGQQIAGIRTVWRDSDVFIDGTSSSTSLPAPFAQAVYSLANQQSGSSSVSSTTSGTTTSALAQAHLSLATGANGQAVCSALSSPATNVYWMFNPNQLGTYLSNSHALGYSGLAYVYASNYTLNSGATIPNHSFEVQSTIRQVIGGITQDDANPADIVNDFLPSVPQWPTGIIGSTTQYQTYCLAAGLLLSPYLDSARAGSDLLKEVLACSNSDAVWSDGTLKIVPYGDTTITGNGVTFTPNLTPVYNLQLSDILEGGGDDPIKLAIRPQAQCFNSVQVEFLDRSNQYVTDLQPASDPANIDQYGLNKQDPVSLHAICLRSVAAQIAQIMVQRSTNVRHTCTFKLPETFGLLDPMDLVTVPLRSGGSRLVRILEADEKDGEISITAEEMLIGAGHAAQYTRQTAIPAFNSYNADPGSVATPIVIHPPASLVSDNEVWLAAAHNYPLYGGAVVWISTDDTNYNAVGTIAGPSTYGVLTASLPVGLNPDTTHTLAVDMSLSGQALQTVTAADATGGVTLAIIDNELVAFQTATVTGTNTYNLTTLQRGYGGTTIAAHSAGVPIIFLHGALFKYVFNSTQLGSTLYFKLQAFNAYGAGYQDISTLSAYSVTLAQTYSNAVSWASVSGIPANIAALTGTEGINNALVAITGNRVPFSQMEGGVAPWTIGALSGGVTGSALTSGSYQGLGYIKFTGTASASGQAASIKSANFPATGNEWVAAQAGLETQNACTGELVIWWVNSSGGSISSTSISLLGASTAYNTKFRAVVQAPAGAVSAWLEYYLTSNASGSFAGSMEQPSVTSATAGQTVYPAFSAGPNAHDGADVTSANTAAAIAGQGPLATSGLTAAQVANTNVSIAANGALSGAGGGAVTIGGLGYTGALDATKGAPAGTSVAGLPAADVASTINSGGGVASSQVATVALQAGAVSDLHTLSNSSSRFWTNSTAWNNLDSGITLTPASSGSVFLIMAQVTGWCYYTSGASTFANTLLLQILGAGYSIQNYTFNTLTTSTLICTVTGLTSATTFNLQAAATAAGSGYGVQVSLSNIEITEFKR